METITAPTVPAKTLESAPERRAWTAPRTVCLEARPEVSAYTGTGSPWLKDR